jgi:hypothetical protein
MQKKVDHDFRYDPRIREDLLHGLKLIPLMQQLEMPHNFQKSVGAVICEEKLLMKDNGEKLKKELHKVANTIFCNIKTGFCNQ